MLFLRQSTASQEVLLGPFVSDTDGKTAQTGLTIASTDIKLWVEGATTEANKTSGGATHIAAGRYYAVLDATDTATVGKLEINVHVAGALPVRREFHVLEEAVYDSLFAAAAAGYQVPIWAASNSTVNLSGTTVKAVTEKVAATIAAGDIATDAVDAASVKADAVTKIQNGLATPTNITAGTITTVTNLTNAPTNGDLTATMKASINTEADTALSDYGALKPTTAGRTLDVTATGAAGIDFGNVENQNATVTLSGTTIADVTQVGDNVDTALAELAKVPKSDSTVTWNATALGSINSQVASALGTYDPPTNAEMVARTLAAADYATATDLGTVDTVVDAIKVKTDQFVFTVANQVDANALSGGGGLDAAGVRAAVGLASANLDTQLTAIDDYLDTEVAAIKAKTDLLTTFPANFSSLSIDSTGFVGANVTNSGTAASGGASAIVLGASASLENDYYNNQYVQIVSGTGAGQVRQVADYTGASKQVTTNFAWTTTPDNTSVYRIIAAHVPHVSDNSGVTRAKDENDASLATAASLNTVDDFLDTEVAAILAAVDTEVAAIKAKTDQLTFTVANQVDSNALSGGGSGLDAAGVRSALGMSSANLDTQLADIPTVAEFEARTIASASYATATALGTTDTAVQTLTTRVGIPAVSVSDDLAAVKTDTGNLVTRITSTLFSGITSLAQMLGIMAGKQVGDTTARNELRATGAGSGTFDETTDSMQAVRDRGDAAWTTATGFAVPGSEMGLADGAITAPKIGTGAIAAAKFAAGAIDAAALNADAVAEIQSGLSTVTTAQVLTQVNAALDTAIAELGIGTPATTPSIRTALMLLYMEAANESQDTTTQRKIKNAAGTVIAQGTVTSATGSVVLGKLASP